MTEGRIYEAIKYVFTRDEVTDLGAKLARECQQYADVEHEKAQAAAAFGAEMKAALGRVADLTQKINNGYELRNVECIVLMEVPRPGMKTLIRADTNEPLRSEPMTMAEMQSNFGFGTQEGEST